MLELKNISFSVEDEQNGGQKNILTDISLHLSEREFMVITGPNGSGKSTLAKIIMGIVKPTEGRIILDGIDITETDVSERAHMRIGYAFQQPVRFKGICVADLLRLAAGRELPNDEACRYLSEVGLCAVDYVNREINGSLSGGELKRIEIATLLARSTRIALFDEPEAGIDLWSFQNLTRIFEKMRSKHNSAAIIISHQERILNIADTIVMLADGRIVKKGSCKEVMPELPAYTGPCEIEKNFYPDLKRLA